MTPVPKPSALQLLHNEKLKSICEGRQQTFENLRTQRAEDQTRVDFLTAIASNLGVKPTAEAKKHSKKPGKRVTKPGQLHISDHEANQEVDQENQDE